MINNKLNERTQDTVWEIFPLDRQLPKSTVLHLFEKAYSQSEDKNILACNSPETKRIREAYWSLFGCVALDIVEQKDHSLVIPSSDANDIHFLSQNDLTAVRPRMNCQSFDVKEYFHYSATSGFEKFIQEKVNPRRKDYGIIIGVQADIENLNPALLIGDQDDRPIILISSTSASQKSILEGRVVFVMDDKIVLDTTISLLDHITRTNKIIIYQDVLRGLPY